MLTYMKKNIYPKISYNKEARVLRIQLRQGKSADSDIERNTVIDYDKQGNVINVEIMPFGLDEFKAIRTFGAQMPTGAMIVRDK